MDGDSKLLEIGFKKFDRFKTKIIIACVIGGLILKKHDDEIKELKKMKGE